MIMAILLGTYSFISVVATISGPGGAFSLGYGSGNADDGSINIAQDGDKTTATDGADGSIMHSLHASQKGRITFRLLKTSPVNAQLSALLEFQRGDPSRWGQNVITVADINRGDTTLGQGMAFVRMPEITYAKEGGQNEWGFVGYVVPILGVGAPTLS
jgi:hypothetical protein